MTVTPEMSPSLSRRRLWSQIERICSLGNRFVGTPGESAARALIIDEFRAAGLTSVETEEVVVLGYEPAHARCKLLTSQLEFEAVGLQSTSNSAAEGSAIYIGNLTDPTALDELHNLGLSVKNRIIVFHSDWPFLFAERLTELGAIGLVVISPNNHSSPGHYTAQIYPTPEPPEFSGRPLSIPGVTIGWDSGADLLAQMSSAPQRLLVEHAATYRPVATANIVGTISGQTDECVILGAHYDTQAEGVGACDNATGVAALLEIAHMWADLALRRTVILVGFAAEEGGCWGSVSYCRRHRRALETAVGMVNLDALGWVYPAAKTIHADPSMAAFAAKSSRLTGWEPERILDASTLVGSDINPFIDAGVPSCFLWRNPPKHPHYHTAGDDLPLLDIEIIEGTASASGFIAYRLAQEANLSLGRSQPSNRWMIFDE